VVLCSVPTGMEKKTTECQGLQIVELL